MVYAANLFSVQFRQDGPASGRSPNLGAWGASGPPLAGLQHSTDRGRPLIYYFNKGGVFSEPAFFLRTFTAQPIQPTTHTNNTWRLPGWLRASCGRHMRALRLCHTTSQWRGTAAELHGCGVRVTTVLLLLSQHIDRVACGVDMLTEERVVRELLGTAPACRRPSREARSSGTSYSSTAK